MVGGGSYGPCLVHLILLSRKQSITRHQSASSGRQRPNMDSFFGVRQPPVLEQNLKFLFTTQSIDWKVVASLFEQVGWTGRRPSEIRSAFEKSSHVIFIYNADELVAFGRTVDDGQYYGLLVDVVVKPGHQQLGLGREVVNHLRSKLVGYKFITLTAAPGKEDFYLKLGWQRQATALIWPVSEEQRKLHVAS